MTDPIEAGARAAYDGFTVAFYGADPPFDWDRQSEAYQTAWIAAFRAGLLALPAAVAAWDDPDMQVQAGITRADAMRSRANVLASMLDALLNPAGSGGKYG